MFAVRDNADMKHRAWLIALLAFLVPAVASAANVSSSITASSLTLDKPGSITLTWTATGAGRCIASGDWSGSKNVTGGTETVQVTQTETFVLTCDSPTGPTTLTWAAPSGGWKYTNGATLVPKEYQLMSGPSASTLARLSVVQAPSLTSVVQTPPGLTYFAVRVRDASGIESADSNTGSKTVVADSSATSVKVTLAVAPNPPVLISVE